MDKTALRLALRAQRRALSPSDLIAAEAAARAHLLAWEGWKSAKTVALYCDVRGELPTQSFITEALNAGKRVALPCMESTGMRLRWVSALSELSLGAQNIKSPGPQAPEADLSSFDLMLTPGVAFDRRGGRLGQGGGDYDRCLLQLPARTAVVGLCHDFQLLENVPQEPHDRRVGWILTPSGLFKAKD